MYVKFSNGWRLIKWMAIEKCSVLHVGHTNPCRVYDIDGVEFPSIDVVRDLGVLVSRDMKFAAHINNIAQKAFVVSNLFFRAFKCRRRDFVLQFFKSYIRPLIESCTTVWSPHLMKDVRILENVQRKFTKRVPGLSHMSYSERRNELGLDTLELRRLHNDLLFC